MIMDSALFITSLSCPRQRPHNLLLGRSSYRLRFDYPPISWTGWWICSSLDVLLRFKYYGPDMDRSQRPPFWKSVLVIPSIYVSLVACFSLQQASYQLAYNPVLAPLPLAIIGAALLALRFYLKKRLNIRSASAGPTVTKKRKELWHIVNL